MSKTLTYLDLLDDPEEESEWENADTAESEAPLVRNLHERTPVLFPSDSTWFSEWRERWRSERNDETLEESVPVVLARREGDPALLMRGPKKVVGMALALGWKVDIRVTEVRRPDTLFKHASDEHNRGDVRYKGGDETWWFIMARHPQAVLAFRAVYTETVTPSGGRGFSFEHASAIDPVGMPTELYYEYKAPKASKVDKYETTASVEARQQHLDDMAADANRMFNTGKTYRNHRPLFTAAKEFEAWMGEWVEMLTPKREEIAA